ncbi:1-aminocyclopropane-1-carboxylate deaminase/D-cysteine desulfhydrase [Fulvivirga sp. M361]|uniref:1-aminocyclopropane-1-carboxylate deaminase/D-cysteine desulfhydrase n=1 Tax=Fulvivirga sp. M361 TaxID=2594266 RepID=UPI00117B7094|nr:pyridoxal-phosphate dependent enzyme [Fulvivirga sp. M361]TRX58353.1 1-aminocyclopropane-1-carboxylate deaminase/D-cysteine desulfhydrase [Fulvivirga sp. M361]
MLKLYQEPYIQEVHHERLKNVRLFVKREDLIHPYVSGNKWRKLKYNLIEARNLGHDTLLTFGGAYSNHIYATAAAANEAGLNSIGIIRGEELQNKSLNKTLTFARKQGMQLEFIDRKTYRLKSEAAFLDALKTSYGDVFVVPEGGTNRLALKGCEEMVTPEVRKFDYVCCSSGTGGTVSGTIAGMQGKGKVIGFSALKGDFLKNEVRDLITDYGSPHLSNWEINTDYHFGGYAKRNELLDRFIEDFEVSCGIPLDQVYTGKMMYGVFDLVEKEYFPRGTHILAIHTGGLQGKNY